MGCGASASPPPEKSPPPASEPQKIVETAPEPKAEPQAKEAVTPRSESSSIEPAGEKPAAEKPPPAAQTAAVNEPAKPAEATAQAEAEAPPSADAIHKEVEAIGALDPKEALPKLLEQHPFLNREDHFLHQYVERCQNALDEDDQEGARDALDLLTMELEVEEKLVLAAFSRFDNHKDHSLQKIEVEFMLDYLGFPNEPADVEKFVDILDKNEDDAISFQEFLNGVGRMGGSAKLFELRRTQVESKAGSEDAKQDENALKKELQACGIQLDAQLQWKSTTSGSEFDAAACLQPCQKAAIRHIRAIAQVNHERALPKLLERVAGLGFKADDLWMCLAWIRELSPIIIHTNLDKIGKFLKEDTHYRNQFETNKSSGLLNLPVRVKWEKLLFGDAYNDAKPFDRPKYGVQNVWNDYRGVIGCKQYGDSYIVLKDVRLRCTLSPCDSGNLRANRLAVLDYYAHVLAEYSDKELTEALRVAQGGAERIGNSEAVIQAWGKYKEAQLHGELDLDKHVDRLVVSERHRLDGKWIEEMCEKHGWKCTWKDDFKKELEERAAGVEMDSIQWQDTMKKLAE